MHNQAFSLVFLCTIFVLCHHRILSERHCRCLSSDSACWPNSSVWKTFNTSVNGQLISPQPSAAVCNSNPPNVEACTVATTQWTNASWRGDQAGALQNPNWEKSFCSVYINSSTCQQGSVPILGVNATLPEHVQATLRLVNTYNLRLVMKTSGHDYFGRSTAAGSFLLWLHYMKNMTLLKTYTLCSGEQLANVIRIGAGVQWGEVYEWLASYNLTAIGGASATVGATGGYLQGGGHGPLTRMKGLAVDQVLEFDVVMADGSREIVNSCENSDLFWALRGGGGGTFGVVLSVVLRTYPSPPLVGIFHLTSTPNGSRYASFVQHFVQLLPSLADNGWAGYFYLLGDQFLFFLFLPNGAASMGNTIMNQLTSDYSDFSVSATSVTSYSSFNDLYTTVLKPSNPTGSNVLLGSRLIPETVVRNQSKQLADALLQLNGQTGGVVIGHLVAGGNVSTAGQDSSVNPAWRTALLHVVYSQSWPDGTSTKDQEALAQFFTEEVAVLQTVSGGSQSGSYMNEANPNEPDWRQKFFGTMKNYNQLKSIKDTVDPNGIFVCKTCVGSDDWSVDLNCPLTSRMRRNNISVKLFFFLTIALVISK